jgi:hypothetical protein
MIRTASCASSSLLDRYSWSFISITGAKLLTRKDGVTIDNFTCNQRP